MIAKRKNADRIKEFSKQLKHFNKESLSNQPKLPSASEQSDLQIAKKKYESNRIRAMEYAKNVPKPKVSNNPTINPNQQYTQQDFEEYDDGDGFMNNHNQRNNGGLYMDEDAFQAAKLQELEAKHAQGKARMDAIKKSIR